MPASFSNDPTVCPPDSESCTELFPAECVCWPGPDLTQFDIRTGDRMDEVLRKLVLTVSNLCSGISDCEECSDYSNANACLSPLNLSFTNITTTSLTLNWDGSGNVVNYNIEFKEPSSLTWSLLPAVVAPTTNATIIGLTPDTVYEFRIIGVCATTSCYSLTVREKTLPLVV
jgi:hypothetical protein